MISLNLDLSDLASLLDMKPAVDKAVKEAARDLAHMTHGKIRDLARQHLKGRYEKYVSGLSVKELENDVFLIVLDEKSRWVEDGQKPFDMLDGLLKSPKAKMSKSGAKYIVVPFDHSPGKGSTAQGGQHGAAQQDLVSTIRQDLKRQNKERKAIGKAEIPFAQIEKGPDGNPLIGRLHSFSISGKPKKTGYGPGQGHGPEGWVRMGPTGIPFLHGVNIYQTKYKGAQGEERTRRSIFTFRTASSNQKGRAWQHPGNEPLMLMEQGLEWARSEWETKISPEIIDKILSSIDK